MGKVKQMLTDEQQEYVEGLRCELSEAEELLTQAIYHQQEGLSPSGRIQRWNMCCFCGGKSKGYSLGNPVEHSDSCPARAFLERNKQ